MKPIRYELRTRDPKYAVMARESEGDYVLYRAFRLQRHILNSRIEDLRAEKWFYAIIFLIVGSVLAETLWFWILFVTILVIYCIFALQAYGRRIRDRKAVE